MERKPFEDISRGQKRVRTPSPDLDPDEMNEEEEEQFGNYMEEYKRVFNLNRLGDERAEKRIYNRAKKAGIDINNTGDFLDWLEEQIEDRLGINNVNTENNPPEEEREQEGMGMFHKQIIELKRKLKGDGIIDTIIDKGKDIYNKAKDIVSSATKLNNTSRKTLEKFGKQKIKKIIATREVVQKSVTTLINLISAGQLDKEKKKMGYDDFFHIRLYCEMESGAYILLEKNEVVFIYPKTEIKGERLPIKQSQPNLTLNELVNKTIKYMGEKDFYTYDAFTNNCASFVIAILKANGLWDENDKAFLLQDVKYLKDKLPKTKQVASYITQLGAIVSRARGKGKFSTDKIVEQNFIIETDARNVPVDVGKELQLISNKGPVDFEYKKLINKTPNQNNINVYTDKGNLITTQFDRETRIIEIIHADVSPAGDGLGTILFTSLMNFYGRYITPLQNIIGIKLLYAGQTSQALGFYINNFKKYGFYLNGIRKDYTNEEIAVLHKDDDKKIMEKYIFFTRPNEPTGKGKTPDYSLPENKKKLDIYNESPFNRFSLKELRQIAKAYKKHMSIGAPSKMSRIDLINVLHHHLEIDRDNSTIKIKDLGEINYPVDF